MAGDWIKVEKITPDKPEIEAIASSLDIDPDAVFGKCFRIWSWFDDHTENGNAVSVTEKSIDRRTGVTGFAIAMQEVGWLVLKNGGITLPNFDRHNGQTAKQRALTSKRVAKNRAQNRNGDSVTESLPEKRREEKRKKPPKSPKWDVGSFDPKSIPIPDSLDRQSFREAWSEWIAYRNGRKKPLSEMAAKKQMNKLEESGLSNAVAAIDDAIANDWQGLFPKPNERQKARSRCPTNEELDEITVDDFYRTD